MAKTNATFEIGRDDHGRTRVIEAPLAELAPGAVRFAVERFALTANTTTYALVGDLLGYWDFFPAEQGWGRVPAIGWGRLVESACEGIAPGGLYFGWFPMARTVDVTAAVTPGGVRDDGAHRSAHAPVYREFVATAADPFYQEGEDAEDRHALLRGMFLTGFLADDFFADSDYYGASRVVVLSASSKTAIAFARCAAARGVGEVVGVTSARNAGFVGGVGCYGRVVTYDDVEKLAVDADVVAIDMAGDGAVLSRVHERLGGRLRYSMTVGMSHAGAPPHAPPVTGPRPELFFAPAQIEKRMRDWGLDGYRQRVGDAMREFVDASRSWLHVERSTGPAALERIWHDTLAGRVPPSVGHVVSV
jgi:Protein of unknown function (DUF2855)